MAQIPLAPTARGIRYNPQGAAQSGFRGFRVDVSQAGMTAAGSAPQIDVRSAVAAEASKGALGEAVAQVGGMVTRLAAEQMELKNQEAVSGAELVMLEEGNKLALDFANEDDETKWGSMLEERARTLRASLLDDRKLSPRARAEIEGRLERWRIGRQGEVAITSFQRSRQKVEGNYNVLLSRAFEVKDYAKFESIARDMHSANSIDNVGLENLLLKSREAQKKDLETDINSRFNIAASQADEALLDGAIQDGKSLLGWSDNYAKARRIAGVEAIERTKTVNAAKGESEFLGEVMMRKAQGEVFTPEQVDSWVAEKKIDKQTGARLRVALKSEVGAMTGEFLDFLNKEVDAYDPEEDPDGLKAFELSKKSDLLGLNQRQRELYAARFERATKVNADPKAKPLEAVRRAAKSQIGEMFKDVGQIRVWNEDLEMALQDPVKMEAWGIPKDQAAKINMLVKGGTADGKTIIPDKAAALRLFREQSIARNDLGAVKLTERKSPADAGLTEWEYNLFQKAADASGDMVADPIQQQGAEFNRAVLEEGFDNWYDSETAKRGAPPSDVEARQWVGDKTRAVIQGAGAANLFKAATPAPVTSSTSSMPATPGIIDEPTVAMIKEFESFIPEAYGDYKQTSVGYGTRAQFEGEVLTEPEADARLRSELQGHVSRVDSLAQKNGVTLTEVQRSALISFDFNTGSVHRIFERAGSDKTKYASIMKEWRKAGGEVLPGLVTRRAKEAAAFE